MYNKEINLYHLFFTLDDKMIGKDIEIISVEMFLFTNEF